MAFGRGLLASQREASTFLIESPQEEEFEMRNVNRQIILKSRPSGLAGPEHFEEVTAPIRMPEEGEVLVASIYLSVDPAMRVWMDRNPGYVPPVGIGDVMRAGGVGRVIESKIAGIEPGDYVQGRLGWQTHPTLPTAGTHKLDLSLGSIEDWIGPLGTTALAAWFGIHAVGSLTRSDTVLISGAAGGVGQMAAQFAKQEGCYVVGIAGGPEKCRYLTEELGIDRAIDYRAAADMNAAVAEAFPEGVDLYFDNVGGPTLDAALANIRMKGRIVLCGRISQTAGSNRYGIIHTGLLIGKRARMEGFIVSDFNDRYDEARQRISAKLKSGELKQKLHVIDGLESAPNGLAMLFCGENTGKLVVKVAD
jgi:NADPH-dependent curcumin reductase CurA